MKKIFLGIVSIILGAGLVVLSACGGTDNSAYDKQIEELQAQITQLRQTESDSDVEREELQNKINKLQSEIDKMEDDKILKYYHEPTIDEDFEDNKVNIILKNSYKHLTEVGFEDFEIVEQVAEITSISCNLKTITRDEGIKLSLIAPWNGKKSQIIKLELATHDKGKVLAVIAQLKKVDMVLCSEPEYIYDIVND